MEDLTVKKTKQKQKQSKPMTYSSYDVRLSMNATTALLKQLYKAWESIEETSVHIELVYQS